MNENLKYWIWLASLPGITPKARFQLLRAFGSPENIWDASVEDLKRACVVSSHSIGKFIDKDLRSQAYGLLESIRRLGAKVITIYDETYPQYLKNIFDPPVVLYAFGKVRRQEDAIAVVGSRNATAYGLSMAESLSYQLGLHGITVVSGMARGVDSYAHEGALRAAGRTIAVLGCGLDTVYPGENRRLASRIREKGAVISEYPPGVPPVPYNFPARNRIISGLSKGVVIVEAGERSGSLITADYALEQGREVFAVPGNIDNKCCKGSNRLIREGAKIVTGIEDILEEMGIPRSYGSKENGSFPNFPGSFRKYMGLDADEIRLLKYIEAGPVHMDALSERSGISVQIVSAVLISLELKGIIEQMPGKVFKIK